MIGFRWPFDNKVQTKVQITVQYCKEHVDRELYDKYKYNLLKKHLELQLVWKNGLESYGGIVEFRMSIERLDKLIKD